MNSSTFDPLEFVVYLQRRWTVIVLSCGLAFGLTFAASRFLLPRKYTAVATIRIQPPGGGDPRAATAVSPIYLESLKGYERFASSDTLFVKALDAVHARDDNSNASPETLKKQILKVSRPANTFLLEVSATMTDPRKAQALAQFIAEQAVSLNLKLDESESAELTGEFRNQLQATRLKLEAATRDLVSFARSHPVEMHQQDVEALTETRGKLMRDLELEREEFAGLAAQRDQAKGTVSPEDVLATNRQIAATDARIAEIGKHIGDLQTSITRQGQALESDKADRGVLDAEMKSASSAYDDSVWRLNEMMSTLRFHGERLQLLDPGIVPREPSSPNVALNSMAALLIALAGSLIYLTFAFGYSQLLSARAQRIYSLH
jgi:uncharacterized protein involved in exopolysaccharide biosynthesis